MAGEDFLLKWNDHHALFFSGAEELCQNEEYTDVTLSAGSKFFPAHKLVLSVCSPYFRQLFRRLGNDKSVIYLKDVEPRHLELLLDYMYKGEIKVEEQELVTVLNTAQGLEIKGLTESGKQNDSESSVKMTPRPEPQRAPAPKRVSPTPPPPSSFDGPSKNYESANKKRKLGASNSDTLFKIGAVDVSPAATALPSPSVVRDMSSSRVGRDNTAPTPRSPPPRPIVKQEVAPVSEDWNSSAPEQQMAPYQDNMSHDTYEETALTATGYEHEGYEEGEYYQDDGMGQAGDQDDRVREITSVVNGIRVTSWRCCFCEKESKWKGNVLKHLVTHTGAKPYHCQFCNQSFGVSSNKRRHELKCRLNLLTSH